MKISWCKIYLCFIAPFFHRLYFTFLLCNQFVNDLPFFIRLTYCNAKRFCWMFCFLLPVQQSIKYLFVVFKTLLRIIILLVFFLLFLNCFLLLLFGLQKLFQ